MVELVEIITIFNTYVVRYLKLGSAASVTRVLHNGALISLANALVLHHFIRFCLKTEL